MKTQTGSNNTSYAYLWQGLRSAFAATGVLILIVSCMAYLNAKEVGQTEIQYQKILELDSRLEKEGYRQDGDYWKVALERDMRAFKYNQRTASSKDFRHPKKIPLKFFDEEKLRDFRYPK